MATKRKTDRSLSKAATAEALGSPVSNPQVFDFLVGWQCQKAFYLLHAAKGRGMKEWDACQDSVKVIAGMIWDCSCHYGVHIPKAWFDRITHLFEQCGPQGYRNSAEEDEAIRYERKGRRFSPFYVDSEATPATAMQLLPVLPDILVPDKKSKGQFGKISRLLRQVARVLCHRTVFSVDLFALGVRTSGLIHHFLNEHWDLLLPDCIRQLKSLGLLPDLEGPEFNFGGFDTVAKIEDENVCKRSAPLFEPGQLPSDDNVSGKLRAYERLQQAIASVPGRICEHARVADLERYDSLTWDHLCECVSPQDESSETQNVPKDPGRSNNRQTLSEGTAGISGGQGTADDLPDEDVEPGRAWIPRADEHPPAPAVQLGRPGEPCIVHGREKKPLTDAQRPVIEALIKEGDEGLGKDFLEKIRPSARRILKTLRTDADWAKVILMPGQTNGRYRIKT